MSDFRSLILHLAKRRVALGMTFSAVAKRAGLPPLTVQRILAGVYHDPSFPKVWAIARALGVTWELRELPVREFQENEAREKAKRVVRMVQGTSGLEEQAVGNEALTSMEEQTVHELLAGSRRKLWSE
jgi:transcriptional regulator with XRE-family HTH domain